MDVWNQILTKIEFKLNPGSFDTWFKPTSLKNFKNQQLYVNVPNKLFKEYLLSNYTLMIEESKKELDLSEIEVMFVAMDESDQIFSPTPARPAPAQVPEYFTNRSLLNPRYTFDSFVVGSCNQFAHAASQAVADLPGQSYNPLFIYGGTGLGKTHLMHAIANQITKKMPETFILYTTTEKFMNELINSIRDDRILSFREHYRNVDVLLIDDVQFLAGKERTQEEFFHTFNTLLEAQKQIVVTSDSPPKEIPTLEERLRSRFEWGLISDIQPPDLETKIAILKKKADLLKIYLADDVALYIASKTKSNVRELEGSLIRLMAVSSLLDKPIDVALARETLRDIIEQKRRKITIENIQGIVSDFYGITVSDLKDKNNSQSVAFPRQIAMYLCKELTGASYPTIGKAFGGKHHTTVIHSVKKIEQHIKADEEFHKLINNLTDSIQ
ncbi:chromosomal replication initiator protein DnaA [Acidobacteriota bacterium]